MSSLDLDPLNVRAGINLAALHHKFGSLDHALEQYRKLIDTIEIHFIPVQWDQMFMLMYIITTT